MEILVVLLGFCFMELFSWFIHKYIMHGPLWSIHKTHHIHTRGIFELNDLFSLFFGSIAVILIITGTPDLSFTFWLGLGITLYGILYFVFHDIVIHRRINIGKKPNNMYLKAITQAHRDHHKSKFKDDSVSFGLFLVAKKYFHQQNSK